MTANANDLHPMLDPRVERLTEDLKAIILEQARPGERLIAVGGVSLDPEAGLAKPILVINERANDLGDLAWALVHETVSRWAIEELKVELPIDAGARAERDQIAMTVTKDWIVTDGPVRTRVAYVFAVTLAPLGQSVEPRIIVGSLADVEQDIPWHLGDAAHLIIQHALEHGDPEHPDVLAPAVGHETRLATTRGRVAPD